MTKSKERGSPGPTIEAPEMLLVAVVMPIQMLVVLVLGPKTLMTLP